MKIAITGHSSGIGKEFSKQLHDRGHEIIGISRRDGNNIRRINNTCSLIEPCDLFINNAQSLYAQTELLFEMWKRWKGKDKYIWNISTMMTESPVNTSPDQQDDIVMSQYYNQKQSLENAVRQLKYKNSKPVLAIIKPGGVATQENFDNTKKADTSTWVKSVIDIFTLHDTISVSEISIGNTNRRIPL